MELQDYVEKLKALGAFEAFERNLKSDPLNMTIQEYIGIWKYEYPLTFERFVSSAFYWEDTSEGHDFWSNIANS